MTALTDVTPRLASRVRRDFPDPGSADALIGRLARVEEGERVQAAAVLWAKGDLGRFDDSLALCEVDWRDALVRGGLAHDDWPERLDAELGTRA
jgi:hypothetical protein